jgi:hypothetical protein
MLSSIGPSNLGWPPERILVIDEDRGKSGATIDNRFGFQRLLAEVSLDHKWIALSRTRDFARP